ncbi:MAG: hypothetical protein QXS20_10415 [Candidatus Thorarchaeota archaeon]
MRAEQLRIVHLTSVRLTKEKQRILLNEFERYAAAVNFTIRTALTKHLTVEKRIEDGVADTLAQRYGVTPEYVKDVVKTARITIARYRRQVLRSPTVRNNKPYFARGTVILSPPMIRFQGPVLVFSTTGNAIPIPLDEASRIREASTIQCMNEKRAVLDRTRLVWNEPGVLGITVRIYLKGSGQP